MSAVGRHGHAVDSNEKNQSLYKKGISAKNVLIAEKYVYLYSTTYSGGEGGSIMDAGPQKRQMVRRSYACTWLGCAHVATQSGNLKSHVMNRHMVEKPYACSFDGCGYKCKQSTTMTVHEARHTGKKNYTCTFEGCFYKSFASGCMKVHEMRHSGEKSHACKFDGCTYTCITPTRLKEHEMMRHTGEKPNVCTFEGCAYRCVTLGSLRSHEMTHTGEKPKACSFDGCDYTCISHGNLKRHERQHKGEKPHACKFNGCVYTATSSCTLKQHEMRHTGEKPHACDFADCGYKCVTMGDKRRHELKHTGEKPCACVVEGCTYRSTSSGNLARHNHLAHGLGGKPTCAICKSRGVKFDTMICIDCKLEHGTSNRGARERWVENGLRDHEDVRLGNFSAHDKALPCGGTSKKYRPDFLWIVSSSYAVVLEVDEDEHKTYDKECEAARIDNLYEGLARDEGIEYMHVVRFNPDQTRVSLTSVLERLCEVLDSQFEPECKWCQYAVEFHGYS